MKIYTLLLLCIIPFVSFAQKHENPLAEQNRKEMNSQVLQKLSKIDWNNTERTTSGSGALYTIPVVVHVIHDYGRFSGLPYVLPDTTIVNLMSSVNSYFLKNNPDTVNIINKFKSKAKSTQITFKLATIDPNGNPTPGIEHVHSYLENDFNTNKDEAKLSQWPPDDYLNIWIVYNMYTTGYGYSLTPYAATYSPYYDGVIVDREVATYQNANLFARLLAQYLGLPNPCSFGTCADADGIPDTPPCDFSVGSPCFNLYDSTCDTPNLQNIMMAARSWCSNMFTYGQGQFMQNVLTLNYGHRDSLVTAANAIRTGMNRPAPDLLPVADFSCGGNFYPDDDITLVGQLTPFNNASWRDTITGVAWTFSNSPDSATSYSFTPYNRFHQPGWVTVSLTATGNNTGSSTLTRDSALYVADTNGINPLGIVQEFDPGVGMANWPIINHYGNNFKWLIANVGYQDYISIIYSGYDYRSFPANATGTPKGDYDDFYSQTFDLTGFSGNCYLNFVTTGASVSDSSTAKDALVIEYHSANGWYTLAKLKSGQLFNKGTISTPYAPSSSSDWVNNAISVPPNARSKNTIFRFSYLPSSDSLGHATGNNVYLDRVYLSDIPCDVENAISNKTGMALSPNPATNSSYILLKSNEPVGEANIFVTDITGKQVFQKTIPCNDTIAKIELPVSDFPAKGMYIVHVITGKINQTEKLIIQ